MASTYSNLKFQLMATGENSGTWGTVTNTNLGTAIEEAITGSANVTFASADVTLTLTNTNSTQTARNLRLNCTGSTGGAARNLILGSGCQIEKVYIVNNGCGDTITIKNTTGSGVAVPAGKTMYVFNNGTDVVNAIDHLSSLTLSTALPVASGGTGSNTGDGSALTNLNASNISLGTLSNARTTADSANTASSIVARDASGNFSANNITANLTGTASNATVLQTARNFSITGAVTASPISFDGSAAVALNVTGINATNINSGIIANTYTSASSSNGASTIVLRDASGNFSANVITANGSGLSALNASNISSGTLAVARGGTGAGDAATARANLGAGTVTSVSGGGSANGISLSGTVTSSGTLSLGGAINASTINTGVLGASYGGTGLSSPGSSGNVLTSNGSSWVSAAPSALVYATGNVSTSSNYIASNISSDSKIVTIGFTQLGSNQNDAFIYIALYNNLSPSTSNYSGSTDYAGVTLRSNSLSGFPLSVRFANISFVSGNAILTRTVVGSTVDWNCTVTYGSPGTSGESPALSIGRKTISTSTAVNQIVLILSTGNWSSSSGSVSFMYQT